MLPNKILTDHVEKGGLVYAGWWSLTPMAMGHYLQCDANSVMEMATAACNI